ncbi:MAG: ABC transporter permease [Crocinitomicaceae bacterium]|nr:ABC transporter permease [Crocinitomicaceae bacterium]
MRNSLLIAVREWKERMGSRSFILFSFLGPLVVLGLIYLLFAFGGQNKKHWNVLISDPANIFDNKILVQADEGITYSFADGYIEIDEFRDGKKYQSYDALFELNEKVYTNKIGHIFFREAPSVRIQTMAKFHVERRLEEIMVDEFTDFTIEKYRMIKQPLTLSFHDVFDPENESKDLLGWAGYFYGAIIFVFVFLFGMTVLRSVSREKSNRIVEVLLASVSPNQLMLGKIIGVGLSALVQFVVWSLIIGAGLYFMRENLFIDLLDASKMDIIEMASQSGGQTYQDQMYAAYEYNEFVKLVYNKVDFGFMLGTFLMFFIAGYFFYGALFAAVGATMGSESDGQQFVLPLVILLCLALYSGYYVLHYPETTLASVLHYLPFTSPVVVMVRAAQGYGDHTYEMYMSLMILIISAFAMLSIASRLYKNGILQFGHRVRIKHIFKWLKKT